MESSDQVGGAESVLQRLAGFCGTFDFDKTKKLRRSTFGDCPLVWDTGALFGLTPVRGKFIDYVKCKIQVNDIARTNLILIIGIKLHKFKWNDEDIHLPCPW